VTGTTAWPRALTVTKENLNPPDVQQALYKSKC
jgi:hypothetical protein